MDNWSFKHVDVKCYVSKVDFPRAIALALIKMASGSFCVSVIPNTTGSWIATHCSNEEGVDIYDNLTEVWDTFGSDAIGFPKQHQVYKNIQENVIMKIENQIYESNSFEISVAKDNPDFANKMVKLAEKFLEDEKQRAIAKYKENKI